MDVAALRDELTAALSRLPGNAGQEVEVFLFGSATRGHLQPCDIDLAVVYSEPATPSLVLPAVESLRWWPPPHATFLTVEEAQEYDFVKRYQAVHLI